MNSILFDTVHEYSQQGLIDIHQRQSFSPMQRKTLICNDVCFVCVDIPNDTHWFVCIGLLIPRLSRLLKTSVKNSKYSIKHK